LKRVNKDPHIKSGQQYCGLKSCQQSRKNSWELNKISCDVIYGEKRKASKKQWCEQHGYLYQRRYRETHPDYVTLNRENQVKRRQKEEVVDPGEQIVKTDALSPERLIPTGVYILTPYRADVSKKSSGKIVKTDALIVQLSGIQHNTAHFSANTT
jgi:bisphosphoglycerate-dependent phosphoglycerate mutase